MYTPSIHLKSIVDARNALEEMTMKAILERLEHLAPDGHGRNIELSGPTQEITPTVSILVKKGTGEYKRHEEVVGFSFSRDKQCNVTVTCVEISGGATVSTATMSIQEKIDTIALLDGLIAGIEAGTLVAMHTMIYTKEETSQKN